MKRASSAFSWQCLIDMCDAFIHERSCYRRCIVIIEVRSRMNITSHFRCLTQWKPTTFTTQVCTNEKIIVVFCPKKNQWPIQKFIHLLFRFGCFFVCGNGDTSKSMHKLRWEEHIFFRLRTKWKCSVLSAKVPIEVKYIPLLKKSLIFFVREDYAGP